MVTCILEMITVTFGEQLKAARKKAGMTQEELASAVQTTKAAVSRYESNQRVPREEIFMRLCVVLNMSVDDVQQLAAVARLSGAQLSKGVKGLFDWFDDTLEKDSTPEPPKEQLALLRAFNALNQKGKAVAIQRVEELGKIPEYQEEFL